MTGLCCQLDATRQGNKEPIVSDYCIRNSESYTMGLIKRTVKAAEVPSLQLVSIAWSLWWIFGVPRSPAQLSSTRRPNVSAVCHGWQFSGSILPSAQMALTHYLMTSAHNWSINIIFRTKYKQIMSVNLIDNSSFFFQVLKFSVSK